MNSPSSSAKLISSPIAPTLIRLSAPMLLAIFSMMAFNLVDTLFVARLGTLPLAAITLTFPVVMVISTFTIGIGVGAMAAISKSIGEGDRSRIRRYATDSLTLSAACVIVLTAGGLASVEPLFRALGATDATMPFVKSYLYVWYPGMVFFVVPMIGNNVMRATGDTLTPSIIMAGGMLANTLLDPLFIFGLGPVPAMGIAGAAVASLVSRGLMLGVSLWVLYFRNGLLCRPWPGLATLLESWKTILATGLVVAVSNAVVPIATGIITRIVSAFGAEAVAGFGVATRIEALGFTLIIALSTGVSPFVGQNYGARKIDRIQKGLQFASRFSLAWGAVLAALFLLMGGRFAALFTNDLHVVSCARLYLWILGASLGLRGVHQIIWTALNVIGRPYDSLILEGILAFCLWIPLAFFGAHFLGISGAFFGLSLANVVAGIIASLWANRVIGIEKRKMQIFG